jgi:hypothetical protein
MSRHIAVADHTFLCILLTEGNQQRRHQHNKHEKSKSDSNKLAINSNKPTCKQQQHKDQRGKPTLTNHNSQRQTQESL